jgi:hypothetical protein
MLLSRVLLSKKFYSGAVIPTFFLFLFMKFFIDEDKRLSLIILNLLIVLSGVIITVNFFIKNYPTFFIHKFIGFLAACSIVNFFFSPNCRIQDLFLSMSYMGLALVPLYIKLSYKFYKLVLVSAITYFSALMYLDTDPNDVFNVSRNFVSIFLLIIFGLHLISSIQNDKQPSLLLLFGCFFISVWAVGRGGILTFAVLVILYPLAVKLKLKYRLIILIFYVFGSLYVFNFYGDYVLKIGFERFQSMGIQDSRTDINQDYINKSMNSFSNVFFGSQLMDIPSIAEVEGNPHNSFIRLHVYYGLFGFIFVIFILISTVIKLLIKSQYMLLYFMLALLIRSVTDSAAFHGPLDPLIFFCVFFAFKDRIITNKIEVK